MSKPLLEGSNARLIGKNQYEADREIASILISALSALEHNNRDALRKMIINVLEINEERARIDYLISQGKHKEALDVILSIHELPAGKTG